MEYHETDEYKARLEHEALDIADDILSGKHGADKASEYAYDIIGSFTDAEFIDHYKEGYADLKHILKTKVSRYDDVIGMAEQRIRDEDRELMADEIAQRAEEDRLDAEQVAREADEAAYATAYGGIDK